MAEVDGRWRQLTLAVQVGVGFGVSERGMGVWYIGANLDAQKKFTSYLSFISFCIHLFVIVWLVTFVHISLIAFFILNSHPLRLEPLTS